MTEIEKSEKLIRILQAINTLDNRILAHIEYVNNENYSDFNNFRSHYKKRIKIDLATKERLKKSYNNLLDSVNHFK